MPVDPYVGIGAGYGGVRYGLYGSTITDSGFMWQVKAGLTYPVNRRLTLDLGYRYLTTPVYNAPTALLGGAAISAHTRLQVVSLGARVGF